MRSRIIWILIKKNTRFFINNIIVISIIMSFHILQLIITHNVYENFLGTVRGKVIGFTKIEVLQQTREVDPLMFYAASVLVQLILFIAVVNTSLTVWEKENHTLKRILTAPVSKLQFIVGSLLANIFVMVILSFIFILSTHFFLDVNWGNSWLGLFAITLFVSFVSAALSMAAFSIFKNTKLAAGTISFFVVVMVFTSGAISAGLQYNNISNLTLNKWAFEAYLDVMQGNSMAYSAPNYAVLGISALIFLIITAIAFRREKALE
jgi:ABC-type multidrug transport system permease subunit